MPRVTPLRIVIAGGGTGGHLYPGIAVAREILARRSEAQVSFAGTAAGIEARVVPREGFALDLIRSGGLKGKGPGARARGLALLPVSLVDAWRVVSRRRPDLVIGVGGYSSGPVTLVASLRRIPTLVLEQNAVPGLTNRLLAPIVDLAAVTYESSVPYFRGKAFVAGNPIRAEFLRLSVPSSAAAAADVRVLVFGGSQGSHAINVALSEAAPALAAAAARCELVVQTGARDLDMVRRAFGRAGLPARVEPYFDEMDREMSRADLVVCRAGATTLAEVTAAGRAAILIPLPTATDDHQRQNAEVLREAGAAEVIEQRDLTGPVLAGRVLALAGDPARRRVMAAAARRLARPDAAARIVDRALALVRA
jgi:UDP-N-acetylglucosamine--N-acetylmuramyl-(pentapeptide) pyrophosphoryl-undecaprenol N-acetylglucosamine transferase